MVNGENVVEADEESGNELKKLGYLYVFEKLDHSSKDIKRL